MVPGIQEWPLAGAWVRTLESGEVVDHSPGSEGTEVIEAGYRRMGLSLEKWSGPASSQGSCAGIPDSVPQPTLKETHSIEMCFHDRAIPMALPAETLNIHL
jgi:hypothetical protein